MQEIAAWMLLHHSSVSSNTEPIISGAAGTSLAAMLDATKSAKDRGTAAALFAQLAKTEVQREQMLRLRVAGVSSCAAIRKAGAAA